MMKKQKCSQYLCTGARLLPLGGIHALFCGARSLLDCLGDDLYGSDNCAQNCRSAFLVFVLADPEIKRRYRPNIKSYKQTLTSQR